MPRRAPEAWNCQKGFRRVKEVETFVYSRSFQISLRSRAYNGGGSSLIQHDLSCCLQGVKVWQGFMVQSQN